MRFFFLFVGEKVPDFDKKVNHRSKTKQKTKDAPELLPDNPAFLKRSAIRMIKIV
jgi:hypothetical protein